jgi:hypothetical protein
LIALQADCTVIARTRSSSSWIFNMPCKASSMTCFCEKCGWKLTVIPASDVLPLLPSCPKRTRAPLSHRLATVSEAMAARFKGPLGR